MVGATGWDYLSPVVPSCPGEPGARGSEREGGRKTERDGESRASWGKLL